MPGTLINPGAFDLGAVLAGGGRLRTASKNAEELRLMQLANLQAETDRKVDEAIQEKLKRTSLQGVADDPTMDARTRNLTISGTGSDYAGATSGALHQQEFDARAAALKAAMGGDQNAANAILMSIANGPVDLAKIEDHTVLNPTIVGGGQLQTNDVGDAVIAATEALKGQRDSAAHLSDVKAAAGGFKPSGPGKAGKPGKYTNPTAAALNAAFNGSHAQETDFIRWRSAHPELTNGNEALDKYRLEAGDSGAKVHIIDPRMPGSMTIQPPAEADHSLEANLRNAGAPPDVIEAVTRAVQGGQDFNIPAGKVPVHKVEPAITKEKGLQLLQEARHAVQSGADPAKVKARLYKMGYHLIADRI
jgi:hypothetical protein